MAPTTVDRAVEMDGPAEKVVTFLADPLDEGIAAVKEALEA